MFTNMMNLLLGKYENIDTTDFESVPSYEQLINTENQDFLTNQAIWNELMEIEEETPELNFWHPYISLSKRGLRSSRASVSYVVYSDAVCFAVAYCAPSDQWNRSLGREIATDRLESGEGIEIPTGHPLTKKEARELIASVIETGHLTGLPHAPHYKVTILD